MVRRPLPEARPWVERLGAYIHIFGPPAPGTFGYLTSRDYLDHLIERAQEREDAFSTKPERPSNAEATS